MIQRVYQSFCKTNSIEYDKSLPIDAMRKILFEFDWKNDLFENKSRGTLIPPVQSLYFDWSPIRDLMKQVGAEMVSKDSVNEIMLYLEDKIRYWTYLCKKKAQGGEITEEIVREILDKQ